MKIFPFSFCPILQAFLICWPNFTRSSWFSIQNVV